MTAPDDDRPCSCEEALALRERVRELEAERDQLTEDIGSINNAWHAETMRKLAAEAALRALRERVEKAIALIEDEKPGAAIRCLRG